MRTWMADLTGLVIGFAIGGAALVHFLPQIEQWYRPGMVATRPPAPRPTPAPSAPAATAPAPRVVSPRPVPSPAPLPAPLPAIARLAPPPAPMPSVVYPDQPDVPEPPPKPGTGMSGTGFFVADGLLMTAAHVVPACQRAEIISPFVPRTAARVLARDTAKDVALLRVSGVTAPAILALGRPTAASARVFVLGYPATADTRVAAETWGTLENDKLPPEPVSLTDPRQTIWMQASAVTHGYSGGPIFDPRSGKVVGIVRGMMDGKRLRTLHGMPTSGMTIGPGSARLSAFLDNEAPGTEGFPADQWGEDPLVVARRATVHVFCWH